MCRESLCPVEKSVLFIFIGVNDECGNGGKERKKNKNRTGAHGMTVFLDRTMGYIILHDTNFYLTPSKTAHKMSTINTKTYNLRLGY